jgi:16S rRNA (guanine1207-N2)-methyltransferase
MSTSSDYGPPYGPRSAAPDETSAIQDATHDDASFHKFVVELRGQELLVVGKPGVWSWDRVNPGTAALLEMPRLGSDENVLDLGCGTGVIGAIAALQAPQGHATLVDSNLVAATCARRTLEENGVTSAEVRLGDGVEGLDAASFDLVLCHLPRGRDVQRELIRGGARVLRPGGRFYFVASVNVGIKGAVAYARELFGRCGVVRQKKGYHVAMTMRPEEMDPPPLQAGYVTRTVLLDGVETSLVSKPGVFAWDRVDEGTARLIDSMAVSAGDRVLDLGCGTGLAGLAAARRVPNGTVSLVDTDLRAVRSARYTLEANSVPNADVLLSDGVSRVISREPFDVVITNPPFHQGREVDYAVAHQFVRDSQKVLRPGGRLFLVANRFIGYDDLIGQTFGNVDTAYSGSGYHVLTAQA